MICKECGAYNPDHATYCKVCAANLKGDPVEETPVVEEDTQPTKRFSRPSWVVPEQTKEASEFINETEEQAEEIVCASSDEIEETQIPLPVEPEVEEEAEEPADELSEEIWTPVPAKRAERREVVADEEDDDEDEEANDEEEPEDIYNDEEELDTDDESFEYEPTPPKRKHAKKKGNTLFTVLLIAIIVVIVCILVAGGLFLLSTNGVLKCTGNSLSALSSCGAKKANTDTTDPSSDVEATPDSGSSQMSDTEALLEEYTDADGKEKVDITILVPSGATVTIDFPYEADFVRTNDSDTAKLFRPSIEKQVFYPNEPLDTETLTIEPDISITTADGDVYKVNCASFTCTLPKLSITLTSPIANEDGTIMASEGNVVHFEGKINEDVSVKLMINDAETVVYTGGVFAYDYKMTGSETETITLTASKNNFVTATTEVSVDPYVFVREKVMLDVKDDIASLRADKSGKLTVTGTTTPGATLTAVSDNQTSVFCHTVSVDAEGKFSFQVTMDSAFYGVSKITLTAEKKDSEDPEKDAEPATSTFIVSRSYADKDAFVKAYNKTKTYKEIGSKLKIDELLANQSVYATNNYGFRVTATVTEVTTVDGDVIVKMTVAKTEETIYVHNMSTKWAPSDNVGAKYNVYGNFMGTYEDTGCAEFIGWFVKKAK